MCKLMAMTSIKTIFTAGLLGLASLTLAQTTKPAGGVSGPVEIRAGIAMSEGDYTTALPLLKQMAKTYAGDPMKSAAVAEQIRVAEANLAAPAGTTPAGEVATAPDKRAKHARPADGKTLELSIKELANFDYDADKGGNLPKDVVDLSGSVVRLRGYMIPMDQADAVSKFALVPSLFSCCFGQPPQLQHTIIVTCPAGKAVNYFPEEISVEGKLTVQEKRDDGFIVSVFEMEAGSVKAAAK